MPNVSVDIEESLLNRVTKVASDRKTTVPAMVRSYLERLATGETISTAERIEKLRELMDSSEVEVGPINWTREDLHVR